MPQVRTIQSNFSSGYLGKRMRGRVDLQQYASGAAELTNVLVHTQGGVTRRSGSYFVVANKSAAGRVRLVPFIVSNLTAYVLEFGAGYVRFMHNRGQLLDGTGVPLELATPYTLDELRSVTFSQSADVLYAAHVAHPPIKLSRTGAASFQIDTVIFANGPYDSENTGDIGATGTPATTPPATDTGSGGLTGTDTGGGGGDGGGSGADGGGGGGE